MVLTVLTGVTGTFSVAAPTVVTPGRLLSPAVVMVTDGRIEQVRAGTGRADYVLPFGVLAPGLIDLQTNGALGIDFQRATVDELRLVAAWLPTTGVTSFLPTVITGPLPEMLTALGTVRDARGDQARPFRELPRRRQPAAEHPAGARILGAHVEGPFLNPSRRGAHEQGCLRPPTAEAIRRLLDAAAGTVRMITLAPELSGAIPAVRQVVDAGVVVSLGHSDATAAETAAAVGCGARAITHAPNACRPMAAREPGLVGLALTDRRLTLGLIADLHHVAGAMCRLLFAAAPGRVMLVTDSTAAAGMPPGTYSLGSSPATVAAAGEPPRRPDGTLAGSALRLDEAVANVAGLGIPLLDAVEAASTVPADLLGLADRGRIVAGARADLVWLDRNLRAVATWVDGKIAAGSGRLADTATL